MDNFINTFVSTETLDIHDRNALMSAIVNNQKELAMALYNCGEYYYDCVDSHGNTTLMLSIINSNHELTKCLIENEEDLGYGQINNDNETALTLACGYGIDADLIVKMIKSGKCDEGHAVSDNMNAFGYAVECFMLGDEFNKIAMALIETGRANPMLSIDEPTLLIYLCKDNLSANISIINNLLKMKDSPNYIDAMGKTAFAYYEEHNISFNTSSSIYKLHCENRKLFNKAIDEHNAKLSS